MNKVENEVSVAFIMVGVPCSGKSTAVKFLQEREVWNSLTFTVLSTDDELEQIANEEGISYEDAFRDHYKLANSRMEKKLVKAIKANAPIIWDQTNLGAKKRMKIVNRLGDKYMKVGVDCMYSFNDEYSEIFERLHKRNDEGGKKVPLSVVSRMIDEYEPINLDEGWDFLITPERIDVLGAVLAGDD